MHFSMAVANAYGLQLIIQEVNIQPLLAILGHQTSRKLVALVPPTSNLIGPLLSLRRARSGDWSYSFASASLNSYI